MSRFATTKARRGLPFIWYTLFLATVMWEGICFFIAITTILAPFATELRYALDHLSSWISFISPQLEKTKRTASSGISGRRFSNLTRFAPIPAISIFTCDISPLSCLYSDCPVVEWSTFWKHCNSGKLMYTWRRGPSICTMFTAFSGTCNCS